jgi:phenylacetate-CoA ligase
MRRVSKRRAFQALKQEVLESQWLAEDLLRELQFDRLRSLLKHAYDTTRYYRELFDDMGLRPQDIRSLSDYARYVPPLEKRHVRERLEDLVSSEWKDRCEMGLTSGSTGMPTRYAHPKSFPMYIALWAWVDSMCGLEGGERTLHLWGNEFGGGRYHIFESQNNTHRFSIYCLPPNGFEELLDLIVEWRPEFIYGYASLLTAVAEALEERGHRALGVKALRTTSEKLFDRQRETMERVFGGPVFDHYASLEIYSLGIECSEHEGMHLFSPLRLFELEPLDECDSQTGELLVTDLVNVAMPFLRYRIGDVVTLDRRPCHCGRRLPRATIYGRASDLIRLRDGSILGSHFFDDLVEPERVERYRIHQRSLDRLDVHIQPTDLFTLDYRDFILGEIEEKLGFVDVRCFVTDEIDAVVAGKYRDMRSDVSAQMVRATRTQATIL